MKVSKSFKTHQISESTRSSENERYPRHFKKGRECNISLSAQKHLTHYVRSALPDNENWHKVRFSVQTLMENEVMLVNLCYY